MRTQSTHVTLLQSLSDPQNETAWTEFVRRYGELIRGIGRRHGLSAVDQEDVLQDVLTTISDSIGTFEYDPEKGRFRGYLKTIALRTIYARFRQTQRQRIQQVVEGPVTAADDQFESIWEEEWRQHHVRHAMRHAEQVATSTDLAAFRAYAIEARPAQEVSEALGISTDCVYQAKTRVLRIVRQRVAEQIEDEG